jgi:hypothetical protein
MRWEFHIQQAHDKDVQQKMLERDATQAQSHSWDVRFNKVDLSPLDCTITRQSGWISCPQKSLSAAEKGQQSDDDAP